MGWHGMGRDGMARHACTYVIYVTCVYGVGFLCDACICSAYGACFCLICLHVMYVFWHDLHTLHVCMFVCLHILHALFVLHNCMYVCTCAWF